MTDLLNNMIYSKYPNDKKDCRTTKAFKQLARIDFMNRIITNWKNMFHAGV